jgi:hypothetical protein
MKIHEFANRFPMMDADELASLAADIKANGLIRPIVTAMFANGDGEPEEVLIDGRNRLRACELAEVKPRFEKLNGHDPVAYIVSANLEHRFLTKGQRAMALAFAHQKPPEEINKGGRGKKDAGTKAAEPQGLVRRLAEARFVLRVLPERAAEVLMGAVKLDAALKAAEIEQANRETKEAKTARLRAEAPALAARVAQQGLDLDEAMTLHEANLRKTAQALYERRVTAAGLVFDALAVTALANEDTFALIIGDPEIAKIIRKRFQEWEGDLAALNNGITNLRKIITAVWSEIDAQGH